MKKMIYKKMVAVIVIGTTFLLLLNYLLQTTATQKDMVVTSREILGKVEHILYKNEQEVKMVEEEFEKECLLRAKSAAYILQHEPGVLEDLDEMRKIARLLQVDEFHVFDSRGRLYAGSEPKYYGMTFYAGEQIGFFLPMLQDKSMELCQGIEKNTAENKVMQYAAVWQEDGKNIVQVGLAPERVMEITEKNKLSYIFSHISTESDAVLFAVDPKSKEIIASTNGTAVGVTLQELGVSEEMLEKKRFHVVINDEVRYCYLEETDSLLLGRSVPVRVLYRNINENSFYLFLFLICISGAMVFSIFRYLDQKIIRGIGSINRKLLQITNGALDEKLEVRTVPELEELCSYINDMITTLLLDMEKISYLLDAVQLPVGVYEYERDKGIVQVTNRVPEILELSDVRQSQLQKDYQVFEAYLDRIRETPFDEQQHIYEKRGVRPRYLKIESFQKEKSVFGVIMDVTSSIQEKQQLREELETDLLTGISSRRGFFGKLEKLFQKQVGLQQAVVVMIDADNLKWVNDRYGHENGDRYLRKIASLLCIDSAPGQVTARLSGDEFAILIYGCQERQQLDHYIALLSQKRGAYMLTIQEEERLQIQFSMGCAYYGEDGTNYHDLLRIADERMYEEKRRRHTASAMQDAISDKM